MTRQYESEVPVRITLFLDGSGTARSGSLSRRPLDSMNRVAANIASAAIHSGDQFGLVTIDEQRCSWHQPGYGARALQTCLRQLASFSSPPLSALCVHQAIGKQETLRRLHRICMARYPDSMHTDVNRLPFSLFPISPWARVAWKERVQLANTLSGVFGLDATTCGLMYTDDQLILKYGLRLAAENGRLTSCTGTTVTPPESWDWAETVRKQMTRAITVARDNEVFVLLTDVLKHQDQLAAVLETARLAVARHHRVVIIGPEFDEEDLRITPRWLTTRSTGYAPHAVQESDILSRAAYASQELVVKKLKRQVRKSGASISFSGPSTAAQIVLEEASLAGSGRTARAN
jgi:uncharacterized protein (DUF58 family)